MFRVEYKEKNNIKPWMIIGGNDWIYLLGTVVSSGVYLYAISIVFRDRNYILLIVLVCVLLLFLFKMSRFTIIRRNMIRKHGSDDWTKEVLFNEEEIIVTERTSKGVYTDRRRYREVVDIMEDDHIVRLKMSTIPHIHFSKDAFSDGDW